MWNRLLAGNDGAVELAEDRPHLISLARKRKKKVTVEECETWPGIEPEVLQLGNPPAKDGKRWPRVCERRIERRMIFEVPGRRRVVFQQHQRFEKGVILFDHVEVYTLFLHLHLPHIFLNCGLPLNGLQDTYPSLGAENDPQVNPRPTQAPVRARTLGIVAPLATSSNPGQRTKGIPVAGGSSPGSDAAGSSSAAAAGKINSSAEKRRILGMLRKPVGTVASRAPLQKISAGLNVAARTSDPAAVRRLSSRPSLIPVRQRDIDAVIDDADTEEVVVDLDADANDTEPLAKRQRTSSVPEDVLSETEIADELAAGAFTSPPPYTCPTTLTLETTRRKRTPLTWSVPSGEISTQQTMTTP
ncbi:hypothetical protein K438DRAFT_2097046 [Mycena galopus ATCC 62051]|nr:hypothetical protein K438DRAFT_2097046 [Mycena galopus ATCC 62051]